MAELSPPVGRCFLPLLFGGWALGTAWCLAGVPPSVDLAGHGAQMQTLVSLFRGDPLVGQYYRAQLAIGYGLEHWLFLPLAWVTHGALAAKVAMWCALQLFVLSLLVLARLLGRPDWLVVLGLPLAFNMSYWYGLLPGLFAQSLILFSLAAFLRAKETRALGWVVALNLLAAATLLSHLLAFALIPLTLGAVALAARPRLPALRTLLLSLGLPAVLSLARLWTLAQRAFVPGPYAETDYAFAAHFNWFFKHFRPEGALSAVGPLAITGLLLIAALWKKERVRKDLLACFLALVLTYLATPKTLSGIYLVAMRLPVTAGMVSLFLVDPRVLPRWLRAGLFAIVFASLGETAIFHWKFAREVDGLWELVDHSPSPGRHGYLSLRGQRALGAVPVYLEHLGEWWTARQGGVGHNFFANYDHHPVQQKPGTELPLILEEATPSQREQFDQVLVLGEGPLPSPFDGWREVAAAGHWRRFQPKARR